MRAALRAFDATSKHLLPKTNPDIEDSKEEAHKLQGSDRLEYVATFIMPSFLSFLTIDTSRMIHNLSNLRSCRFVMLSYALISLITSLHFPVSFSIIPIATAMVKELLYIIYTFIVLSLRKMHLFVASSAPFIYLQML